jgi:Uma2 family endonuclease
MLSMRSGSLSTQPKTFLTPEQYLEIEREAEYKSEYLDGEMFAMAGAGEAHTLLVANLMRGFGNQFRLRPCRVYSNDMRVRVRPAGLYTYPDVAALCGEPRFLDDQRDTLLNPNVIVEVLSPSTEACDRGRKFEHYQAIESLREYLLLASDRIHADPYLRQPDDRWLLTSADAMEDSLTLESVGARLKLADLYEKVELGG